MFFKSTGLTLPGEWLATAIKTGEKIPNSPLEEYNRLIYDFYEYGVLNQSYLWEIKDKDNWTLAYKNIYGFYTNNISQIKNNALEVKGESILPEFSNEVLSTDSEREVVASPVIHDSLPDGWKNFTQTLKPNIGSFRTNESVLSSCYLSSKGTVEEGGGFK